MSAQVGGDKAPKERRFRVWDSSRGQTEESAQEVLAVTPTSAAERWAKRREWDNGRRTIGTGSDALTVSVMGPEGLCQVKVMGWLEPRYWGIRLEANEGRA